MSFDRLMKKSPHDGDSKNREQENVDQDYYY